MSLQPDGRNWVWKEGEGFFCEIVLDMEIWVQCSLVTRLGAVTLRPGPYGSRL